MLFFLSHLSAHTRPTPYPRGFLARTRPFRRISVPGLRGPCARSRMPLCPLTGLPQPRPVVAAWGGASVSSLLDAVLLHECSSVWFLCGPTGPHQPLSAPACFHFACCAVLSSRLRPSVVSSLLGTAGPAPPPLQPLRQVWRPGPLSSRGASGVLGPGCARPELPLCPQGTAWSLLSTRMARTPRRGERARRPSPAPPGGATSSSFPAGRRSARRPRKPWRWAWTPPSPAPGPQQGAGADLRPEHWGSH